MQNRCDWCLSDPLYIDYHDQEWGVPLYDDQRLFEFLVLEGMQAGLSWLTILRKREAFRKAFYDFDARKIVRYTPNQVPKLLENPAIIRNRLKINSVISNANAYLSICEQYGSFSHYIWQFSEGKVIQNQRNSMQAVPASTALSDHMSKHMKKQGFKFVGSTICYAYMQAIGMVNDHLISCFRYQELQ